MPCKPQRRRRCPVCFEEGPPLGPRPEPEWLREARERSASARAWVYSIELPAARRAQVGFASDLYGRLRSRWHATLKGRFGESDAVPFLYNALLEGRGGEIRVDMRPFHSEGEARAAEARLRADKERAGWHEGGMR